jgi:uncharacterized damage-inducible protein DinB
MPAMPPPVATEREGLMEYLAQQRFNLKLTSYGLTDEQARATPSASALSVGGIVKHVALTEHTWTGHILRRPADADFASYQQGFVMGQDETLESVIARYDEVAAETAQIVGAIDDLGYPVPVPPAPWNPKDVTEWSVRWVLLHIIEETARHGGHADVVRESVDGATFFPLLAASEGWPASPWLTPWRPEAGTETS